MHIEELVLHGVGGPDGVAVSEAVRVKLRELLRNGGLPPQLLDARHADRIDGSGEVDPSSGRSDIIGARIAGAVHRGLTTWRP